MENIYREMQIVLFISFSIPRLDGIFRSRRNLKTESITSTRRDFLLHVNIPTDMLKYKYIEANSYEKTLFSSVHSYHQIWPYNNKLPKTILCIYEINWFLLSDRQQKFNFIFYNCFFLLSRLARMERKQQAIRCVASRETIFVGSLGNHMCIQLKTPPKLLRTSQQYRIEGFKENITAQSYGWVYFIIIFFII